MTRAPVQAQLPATEAAASADGKAFRARLEDPADRTISCLAEERMCDRLREERGVRTPWGWSIEGLGDAVRRHAAECGFCEPWRAWLGIHPDGTIDPDGGPLPGSEADKDELLEEMRKVDKLGGWPHRCPFCRGLVWPEEHGGPWTLPVGKYPT